MLPKRKVCLMVLSPSGKTGRKLIGRPQPFFFFDKKRKESKLGVSLIILEDFSSTGSFVWAGGVRFVKL